MADKNVLMVLGGTWHDFDGFAEMARTWLEPMGYRLECTRDPARLADLPEADFDLVVKYTCFSATQENGQPAAVRFTDAHAAPLCEWVAAGGSLLAVHSATVACQSSPRLRRLLGGSFVQHPPAFDVTVHPMASEHPITAGVGAFSARDEFYIHQMEPDVAVHMVALDRGVAHPMVWTRSAGRGRVAYVAPGHDGQVWRLPAYGRLVAQAVAWLCGGHAVELPTAPTNAWMGSVSTLASDPANWSLGEVPTTAHDVLVTPAYAQ